MPGALTTDQLCCSELRQAGFSYDFCYPLVSTVRNAAQIANKIAALFKTEFFNSIDPKRTLVAGVFDELPYPAHEASWIAGLSQEV